MVPGGIVSLLGGMVVLVTLNHSLENVVSRHTAYLLIGTTLPLQNIEVFGGNVSPLGTVAAAWGLIFLVGSVTSFLAVVVATAADKDDWKNHANPPC